MHEKDYFSIIDTASSEEKIQVIPIGVEPMTFLFRDFVTNSSGESWDSSCKKSCVPVKKKKSSKLKMLGRLCNQTVKLKTDSKTLYYSRLKLIILNHNKGYEICIVKQQP